MKKIKQILPCFIIMLLATSCYEDKGNYNYTNDFNIEISSVDESYSVIGMRDNLEIKPTIISGTPDDQLSYMWTLFNPSDNSGARPTVIDTIGYEKNLSTIITHPTGNYTLVLKVKNNNNNYTKSIKTKLSVTTEFSRGFYVLKETDSGDSDMDLSLSDGLMMENLIAKSLGAPMRGAPTRLGIYFGYCFPNSETGKIETSNALAIMTKNDIKIINVSNMGQIYDHDGMFYDKAPNERPYYIFNLTFGIGYLSSTGSYFNKQYSESNVTSTGKYGMKSEIDNDHSPTDYAVHDGQCVTFFDEKNSRFLTSDYKGPLHILSNAGTSGYTPNNIEHKFLYMGISILKDVFAIFEDKNDASKRYLYTLNVTNLASTGYPNPIKSVSVINSSLKFNKATSFATDRLLARIIYFISSNKLYYYDVKTETETLITLEGIGAGEQITHFSNKFWKQSNDSPYNFNYLMVGTQKDGKYKVYMYETVGGQANGAPKQIIEGVGKMIDIHYVSPNMKSRTSISNYSQM